MKSSVIAILSASLVAALGYTATIYAADPQSNLSAHPVQTPEAKNKSDGEAFLAANKMHPQVKVLPDGLQYLELTTGKGEKPGDNDSVTVNYSGKLIDGTEFDSTYKQGQPVTFKVNQVIPGWTEALKLMPAGSTWMLYIPSALAYGEQGAPPVIGPNQVLIFKVELLSVKKG